MATIINIDGRIKNEEKFIVYKGKTYKVDDSKNTITRVYAMLGSGGDISNIETIDKILKELLGAEAVKDFSGLCYTDSIVPFIAAMAAVQNKTYEEVEAAFRNA